MGVRFYDEALTGKIGDWMLDKSVPVLRPDETNRLFEMKADKARDNPISLPFISVSRNPRIGILTTGKRPMSYDGFKIRAYNRNGREVSLPNDFKLNAIPISLQYQLDIYTKTLAEADEYARNFVFNFINYPNLKVRFKYNGIEFAHLSTVHLEDYYEDNSDIPERLFPDQFVRFTISFDVDDAYLFSVPKNVNWVLDGIVVVSKGSLDGEVLTDFGIEVPKHGIVR